MCTTIESPQHACKHPTHARRRKKKWNGPVQYADPTDTLMMLPTVRMGRGHVPARAGSRQPPESRGRACCTVHAAVLRALPSSDLLLTASLAANSPTHTANKQAHCMLTPLPKRTWPLFGTASSSRRWTSTPRTRTSERGGPGIFLHQLAAAGGAHAVVVNALTLPRFQVMQPLLTQLCALRSPCAGSLTTLRPPLASCWRSACPASTRRLEAQRRTSRPPPGGAQAALERLPVRSGCRGCAAPTPRRLAARTAREAA